MSYIFNIWHTHALGQDLSMHAKILIPVTLTSESAFKNCVLVSKIDPISYTI